MSPVKLGTPMPAESQQGEGPSGSGCYRNPKRKPRGSESRTALFLATDDGNLLPRMEQILLPHTLRTTSQDPQENGSLGRGERRGHRKRSEPGWGQGGSLGPWVPQPGWLEATKAPASSDSPWLGGDRPPEQSEAKALTKAS